MKKDCIADYPGNSIYISKRAILAAYKKEVFIRDADTLPLQDLYPEHYDSKKSYPYGWLLPWCRFHEEMLMNKMAAEVVEYYGAMAKDFLNDSRPEKNILALVVFPMALTDSMGLTLTPRDALWYNSSITMRWTPGTVNTERCKTFNGQFSLP